MNQPNAIIMNMDSSEQVIPQPEGIEETRQDRKNKLAAALRLFGKFGFVSLAKFVLLLFPARIFQCSLLLYRRRNR